MCPLMYCGVVRNFPSGRRACDIYRATPLAQYSRSQVLPYKLPLGDVEAQSRPVA